MSRVLLFLCLLCFIEPNAKAQHQLSLNANSDVFLQGRTVKFVFNYVQTEGTSFPSCLSLSEGWTLKNAVLDNNRLFFRNGEEGQAFFKYSLSLASTMNVTAHAAVGDKFTMSFRDGYLILNFNVLSEKEIEITKIEDKIKDEPVKVFVSDIANFPISANITKTDFDVKVGTSSFSAKTNEPAEGYLGIKNTVGGVSFTDMSMDVDYAYGLQFVINKPKGTEVPDVNKTNGQNVAYQYSHVTMPPILYTSMPSADGTQIFCEYTPSNMNKPIPYGAEYSLRWEETVISCDGDFENKVTVNLYNHEPFSVEYECPCKRGTCFADSVVVSAPVRAICADEGSSLKLSANLYVLEGEYPYVYKWYRNGVALDCNSAEIEINDAGQYKVQAVKADDSYCKVSSLPFYVYRDTLSLSPVSTCVLPGETKTVEFPDENGTVSYEWSNGMNGAEVELGEGVYNVVAKNENCSAHTTVNIKGDPHCDGFYETEVPDGLIIPSFFTPNGDGVNDYFEVQGLTSDGRVAIFDRYGKKVAELDNTNPRWDGTYKNHNLPSADYWYVVDMDVLDRQYTGHFSLYRSK